MGKHENFHPGDFDFNPALEPRISVARLEGHTPYTLNCDEPVRPVSTSWPLRNPPAVPDASRARFGAPFAASHCPRGTLGHRSLTASCVHANSDENDYADRDLLVERVKANDVVAVPDKCDEQDADY
jgi:hypothetical protein